MLETENPWRFVAESPALCLYVFQSSSTSSFSTSQVYTSPSLQAWLAGLGLHRLPQGFLSQRSTGMAFPAQTCVSSSISFSKAQTGSLVFGLRLRRTFVWCSPTLDGVKNCWIVVVFVPLEWDVKMLHLVFDPLNKASISDKSPDLWPLTSPLPQCT